jgi:hypothetical protein
MGMGGCRSDCKPARQWGVSGSLYAMRVGFAVRRLLPTPTGERAPGGARPSGREKYLRVMYLCKNAACNMQMSALTACSQPLLAAAIPTRNLPELPLLKPLLTHWQQAGCRQTLDRPL